MDNIPERDAFLEDTGKYDPNNIGGPQISPAQVHLPKMNNLNNKRKLNEWEEAVEMDRLLEQERNVQSKARSMSLTSTRKRGTQILCLRSLFVSNESLSHARYYD